MKYCRFEIRDYRAISQPLIVEVDRHALVPIIGINESGKTTILHAIYAFDDYNDLVDEGKHLTDTDNLYKLKSDPAEITAEISLHPNDFLAALEPIVLPPTATNVDAAGDVVDATTDENDDEPQDDDSEDDVADVEDEVEAADEVGIPSKDVPSESDRRLDHYRVMAAQVTSLRITRRLDGDRKYRLDERLFPDPEINHLLARELLGELPYILFFDDFHDRIDETVRIEKDAAGRPPGWLAYLDRLFRVATDGVTVYDLAEMDPRRRESAISLVITHLNDTLTREWTRFGLEGDDVSPGNLSVLVRYDPPDATAEGDYGSLRLEVVEQTADDRKHHFYLANRSKGFYWFCNFVLKLEFNPKIVSHKNAHTIYLLDEPGSYLHSSMQSRLCEKLRQLSKSNTVIYCTHSQYLLNPAVIPLNTIRIASKGDDGEIRLVSYHDYQPKDPAARWAYQPVWDALQVRPGVIDANYRRIVIAEGGTDHYAYELMKTDPDLGFLPGQGASETKNLISLMVGWHVDFCALWDNDDAGRKAKANCERVFGAELAARRFRLLPVGSGGARRVLEDLFTDDDKQMIRDRLGLQESIDFKKVIETWFYSDDRESIKAAISQQTKDNFAGVYRALPFTPLDGSGANGKVRDQQVARTRS